MAKDRGNYRSEYSALLDDPTFQQLSVDARHTFHALRITRLGNQAGIFVFDEGGFVTLRVQTGLTPKRLRTALGELDKELWIIREFNVLWIRNALRWDPLQNLNNKNHRDGILKVLEGLPSLSIISKFSNYYHLDIPSHIPSRYHRDSIDIPSPIRKKDKEKEQDTDQHKEEESGLTPPTLVELYHEHCPSLRKVLKIEPRSKRWSQLAARLREHPEEEFWKAYLCRVEASDWLAGRCPPSKGYEKSFLGDIDWITGPVNFTQILEGKHDNREQGAKQPKRKPGVTTF